jgi:hypothetical protein
VRPAADVAPEAILVLATLGAPQRRLLRGRRGRTGEEADPEPVPTARVTLIRPEPFGSREDADDWLTTLRRDRELADAELAAATQLLARALHAHRVATADPRAAELAPADALVVRIGFGGGEAVADGRFAACWEPPRAGARPRKRSMEAPEERFAALLGGRERALPAEALVLRARADLDADRPREAALQARVALESLLADLPSAERLLGDRPALADAANLALRGELPGDALAAVTDAVGRMETELRRRRLGA